MKSITTRKRERFLKEIKTTGDIVKNSAIGALRDVGIGVVGGGLVGSVVGRHSFLVGLATSFGGYYAANPTVASLGMGIMAANGFQVSRNNAPSGTQGLEGFDFKQEMENAKQRVVNFRDNFAEKLYLDKFLKKDMGDLGDIDYYLHGGELGDEEDAIAELDRIEEQLIDSAETFNEENSVNGTSELNDLDEEDDDLLMEEMEVNF